MVKAPFARGSPNGCSWGDQPGFGTKGGPVLSYYVPGGGPEREQDIQDKQDGTFNMGLLKSPALAPNAGARREREAPAELVLGPGKQLSRSFALPKAVSQQSHVQRPTDMRMAPRYVRHGELLGEDG